MRNARINERRRDLGLTQAKLAAVVGTTQQQIARIEAGQEPRVGLAITIARALGTTAETLWAGDGHLLDDVR